MTDQQIAQWKVERDIARAIADEESRKVALQKVYDHRDEMQMTCIAHQSSRVKMMEAKQEGLSIQLGVITADLKPLKALKAEVDTGKERFKGAKWGFALAMLLVGKFGWDAVSNIWNALVGAAH